MEKSRELGGLYKQMTIDEECEFLDASLIIRSSEIDGVHLDEDQSKLLAHAVAEKVRQMLGD